MAATEQFLPMLARGDDAAARLFAQDPLVDDPDSGRVAGRDGFAGFARESAAWFAETGATISLVRTTAARGREITEQLVRWGETTLPMALVGDVADDGRLLALRIYHSTFPLTGGHAIRPALLAGNPDAVLSDVVDDYQRYVASKHLDGVLATLEPDGYVRESSGVEHRGADALAAYYDRLFEFGELILEHCTVTDDGTAAALEHNVVRWGPKELTPQAGVAVFERGGSGLLAAVRMYDDVDLGVA